MFLFRTLITFLFVLKMNANDCLTPNYEAAKCVPLRSCAVLLQALRNSSDAIEFVRKSICNNADETVCCGSSAHYSPPSFEKLSRTKRFCGKQHSDDYFHSTNSTIINEFPWLAALEEVKPAGSGPLTYFPIKCVGSLINNRYILTAAQCVRDKRIKITSIRLGEYHVNNHTDCIEDHHMYDCSDPTEEVGIENIIVHPNYTTIPVPTNDIALIRVNKSITYTDYIRPICLPLPGIMSADIDDIVVTSGWGAQNTNSLVVVKAKTYSKLLSREACQNKFSRFNISANHICTLVLNNNTEVVCSGDSGGPVMFSRRNRWHQEGIVSFGITYCPIEFPVINTKVIDFLKWIEDNIE